MAIQKDLFGKKDVSVHAQKKKRKRSASEKREDIIKRLLSSADVREDDLVNLSKDVPLLETLLRDQTKGCRVTPLHITEDGEHCEFDNVCTYHHIIWATDDYRRRGDGYYATDEIEVPRITRTHNRVIRPRAVKSKEEQRRRIKQKAEVFTPSWVCNAQNNLVDEAWFGRKDVFNHENEDHTWTTNKKPIVFSNVRGKTWLDYVTERRLEICCGEAPYIVSRYDATTGEIIPLQNRIGLLDRKLRVVSENVKDLAHWREYAYKAIRSVYGFEWQGDNLLLARENIFVTFIDYYYDFCKKLGIKADISSQSLYHVAYIVSWNLWQMDGMKYIIPYSDQEAEEHVVNLLFEKKPQKLPQTPTGIYAQTAYWLGDGRQKYLKRIEFRNLINKR
jgi:hypothetical protein